jgi:acyl-CoA synthetase (AMP-forming)/AMP-acid ligase II
MPTFSEVLLRYYQEQPEKIAVILQQAGHEDFPVTYKRLVRRASAYVDHFTQQNIQPGEVVILILQPGEDLISAFFGAVLHGAIPSIMPFLTEKLLPERYRADLAALISVTKPSAIVTYPDFETEVTTAIQPGSSVRSVVISNTVEEEATPVFENMGGLSRLPGDIVLLQHSSGTTGLQKGVALSHQAVFNQLDSYSKALHLNQNDIIVTWLPLYHDMGLIAGFLQPILMGIPVVMMSPFDWVRAPYKLMQAVSRYHGTLTWLPNFAYNFCAQKIRDRHMEGVDLSSWRGVINCSEPVRFSSHQAFRAKFSRYGLQDSALCTCYAMAENVFSVTQGGIDKPLIIDEIDRDKFQIDRIAELAIEGSPSLHMVSNGSPVLGVEVKIINDKGEVLPDRRVGEVALRSHCMLTEYYHRPDATEKAFLDGWYLTGDYGYTLHGELFVSGRKKDLIIVGGKNIYPQDLEILAMEVPGVHAGRVSAFGIFNEETGTEDVVIVAEVDEKEYPRKDEIAEMIQQHVTRNSAIALHQVYIVHSHWLVKTSSGKNARLLNREKYLKEINE